MFEKILIADRGEVVFRIARTCERLGIATCAVHVDADAAAAHVTACDEARSVGASTERYTDIAAMIEAARSVGAQAIHPGYGALATAEASQACAAAGLQLIAAPAEVLARLQDPAAVVELARLAGVRGLPRVRVALAELAEVRERATEIGYPLRVRGAATQESAVCEGEDELDAAIDRAAAEVRAAGGDALWLEHPILEPRSLAVQLVSDGTDVIGLGDFEHSIASISEAPAPALHSIAKRDLKHRTLVESALAVAREAGLVGPGLAEFELDSEGRLFFSRLQLGLPPQHALAEMCCTLDLVEVQLRIAAGEGLPAEARRAQPTGHAAEAYVFVTGAAPIMPISTLRWPTVAPGCLRVETDLAVGHTPTAGSTRLVAKLAAYGQTRHQALLTLDRVLAESTIVPLSTDLDFVRSILAHESFRAGQYDSGFAARLEAELKAHS